MLFDIRKNRCGGCDLTAVGAATEIVLL